METCVLIPQEFALALQTPATLRHQDQPITVWTTTNLKQGALFYPFQGTIRIDTLDTFKYLDDEDVRYRFGLYDEISYSFGKRVRHCNWIRFLKVADNYGPQVNMVCTKVKGEPIYEVVKSIGPNQELIVYFLPERPEELFFVRMRTSLYRQTMDSILEGSPLDLSMSLLSRVLIPTSPPSSSEDEHKSISSDSSSVSISSLTGENTGDILNHTSARHHHRDRDRGGGGNDRRGLLEDRSHHHHHQRTPARARSGRGERSLLPCEVCGKAFDRPSLLKRHMRTHTGEKPHVCMVCGKGFSTSSSLNTHRRIHSGEKPHQCQVCGKRFTASSNLYYHRMTHIKEKPHKCSLCSKSFPTPGDLKSHMYVHSGSWPFKCHICSRGFSKHTNLKNHLFLHTGDKPHACELCNKKFALACNLRAHMKTHEGDPQDECVRCGKQFLVSASNDGLNQGVCSNCCTKEPMNSDEGDVDVEVDSNSIIVASNNNNNNNHHKKSGLVNVGLGLISANIGGVSNGPVGGFRSFGESTTEDEESSNGCTEYSDK